MSVFPHFNDDLEPEDNQEPEIIEIKAGDAVGDDSKLENTNKQLAVKLNEASPGSNTSGLKELLLLFCKPASFSARKTIDSLVWIHNRLTNHAVREATAKKLESDANINNANASSIEKKADSESRAQEMKREIQYTKLQLEQIAFFEKHGIEWYAKYVKGELKIIVSKPKPFE